MSQDTAVLDLVARCVWLSTHSRDSDRCMLPCVTLTKLSCAWCTQLPCRRGSWTEFDGCGWDEDQGWCDVEPGCVGAQEADPASRYGGWDLCLASEVGGSNHSTQGAG